jgi:hypothetical protein
MNLCGKILPKCWNVCTKLYGVVSWNTVILTTLSSRPALVTISMPSSRHWGIFSARVRLPSLTLESGPLYGWQSVSTLCCRAHFVDVWPDIAPFSRVRVCNFLSCLCGVSSLRRGLVCPLWREAWPVLCKSQFSHLSVCTFTIYIFVFHTCTIFFRNQHGRIKAGCLLWTCLSMRGRVCPLSTDSVANTKCSRQEYRLNWS